MADILTTLLLSTPGVYRRAPCMAMDSSSTSLPAASSSPLTVAGVALKQGDRVLFTALTSSPNNEIYTMREDASSGSISYYMVPATDGRSVSGAPVSGLNPTLSSPGRSTSGDATLIQSSQLWYYFNGISWINLDTLGSGV